MSHKVSLTQLGAQRQRAAGIYWDTKLPGFGLRVSPKGVKTLFIQYRYIVSEYRDQNGKRKRQWKERVEKLGRLNYLTVAEARERAKQIKAKASAGVNPVAEQQAANAAAELARKAAEDEREAAEFTLAKLVQHYQKEYVAQQKASSAKQKSWLLRQWTRALGERPANAITKEDVLQF